MQRDNISQKEHLLRMSYFSFTFAKTGRSPCFSWISDPWVIWNLTLFMSLQIEKAMKRKQIEKKISRTQLRSDSFSFWNHSTPFPPLSLLKSDDYSSGLRACYIEVRIFVEIGQRTSMLFHKQGAWNVLQIPGTNLRGSTPAAGIQTICSQLCCIKCCAGMLN